MINHRGSEFVVILKEVLEGLKWSYQTMNDVLIFPASGSGGMETAVVNTLSPGDKVLVANIGNFGDRWVKICRAYGLNVIDLQFEWGKAADPKIVAEKLKEDKNREIKAVLFQQNETSTGVLNDVKALSGVIREHGALIIVDAVSGLLTTDLKTDEWGLDVVVSGSQKAFMIPPGLAMVSMSERAWKAYEKSKCPKFYWDIGIMKGFVDKGQTHTTPPISLYFGLHAAFKLLKDEGLENIFKRHHTLRSMVREGVKALGLKLLAEDEATASTAVTAIVPSSFDPEALRKTMRDEYGMVLAGGQGKMKGKIFRIGHLGYVDKSEILAAIGNLEIVLNKLGHKVELGKGVRAAQQVLLGG
jgi:aspartate aminotransferase-like enzyme